MYSLDINLLKDRHLNTGGKSATVTKVPTGVAVRKQAPLFIGIGVGVGLLALTGLLGFLIGAQKAQTQANIQKLDQDLGLAQGETKKLGEIEQQIKDVDAETAALVSVFNQIRPWSALLQELRIQTPQTVEINSIQQTEVPPDAAKGDTEPRTMLKINGFAKSFSDVNDYVLTLQSSPFIDATRTRIDTAQLANYPAQLANIPNVTVTFPQAVQYTITTMLTNTPSSQLLPNIARNGAVGVVTRLKTLEEKGVVKP
ncbi:MAG: hypothetical protein N5P05_003138 [Chroococcopsis gigantea SAG 12.99]|jgi:type IV pilus assembly protein PilN|nr:PilN domain-containing protein [Chlorogloea purpurea SAG 13.99]MDV3001532.1 hypothetical protein [Chroococcopsis gigantea SAG 12.99]